MPFNFADSMMRLVRPVGEQHPIRLKSKSEIAAMRHAGGILALALDTMKNSIVPNETTTQELDEIGGEVLRRHGAIAPLNGYQPSFSEVPYLHNSCISVNSEIIHGVPSKKRILRPGDVVSLDMDASVDGWCADATVTVAVGRVSPAAERLIAVTHEALFKGIAAARPGKRMGDLASTIQQFVEGSGYHIVREMVGHGIGRTPHEPGLDVPNFGEPKTGLKLLTGMTFCIEPMVNEGTAAISTRDWDPWTIFTGDGSLACHWEHTVALTEKGAEILTRLPDAP